MATEVEWIISARWVIPIVPQEILEDHSVIIDKEGKIVEVLKTELVEGKYVASKEQHVVLPEHAIIPGLCNMHTHSAMTLLRSLVEGVKLQDWLGKYIWPSEVTWVSPEFVKVGVEKACVEMIRSGTTLFNDMYFYPDVTAEIANNCGLRACIGVPIINLPTNWSKDVDTQFQILDGLLEKYKDNDKIIVSIAPHAPYTVNDETFLRINKVSEEKNILINLHLHETESEIKDGSQVERMNKLGIINERLLAVHMTQLTPAEIDLITERKVTVIHCPESNFKLGSGICPVNELNGKVNLCVGTDGAASNDDLDLLGEIKTAYLIDNYVSHKKETTQRGLSSMEWLTAATLNAAKALKLDHKIGSLEPGKQADIAAIRITAEPVYNVSITLVTNGTNQVTDVWVAGRPLMRNNQVLIFDEKQVTANAREFGKRIQATLPK